MWEKTADGSPWVSTAYQNDGADVMFPCKDYPHDKVEAWSIHFVDALLRYCILYISDITCKVNAIFLYMSRKICILFVKFLYMFTNCYLPIDRKNPCLCSNSPYPIYTSAASRGDFLFSHYFLTYFVLFL